MRMILVVLYVVFSLIFLSPLLLRAKYLKSHGRTGECQHIVDKWVPRWMRHVLWVCNIRVQIEGREHLPDDGPIVIVCNHQSMLDIPVMLSSIGRPRAMMSKASIGKVPLLRSWMDLFDCLYVKRDDALDARRCYESAVRLVKSGKGICIFPEGTRSRDGGIGKFKTGSFRIAYATGAPIVPMYMHGTRQLLEQRGGWVHSGTVTLKIFEPIDVTSLSKEHRKSLPDEIHAMMDTSIRQRNGSVPNTTVSAPDNEAPTQA